MTAYEALTARFEQIDALDSASSLLGWDSAVMMPPAGATRRSAQMAAMHGASHRLMLAPEVAAWLNGAEQEVCNLDDWQQANLRLMRHQWQHATAVPQKLVERLAHVGSECEYVWRGARKANDFARLRPYLTEVVELVREKAAAKAEALNLSPYDALLDSYDPARRSADIDVIFAELEKTIPELLGYIGERDGGDSEEISAPSQKQLGLHIMAALGFDFDAGRLDESVHPFCSGSRGDIRITARYSESDWFSGLMAVIHETGHALYEQGLPEQWQGQPVGAAHGMAIHESQSLCMEMQLGRSDDFMAYLTPLLKKSFAIETSVEDLIRRARRVRRSFIRVDADEVTYPLHVILRYRLEKALISGGLAVADLPDAWNAGMQELLGITPPDDAMGCMQDIHWMDGSFGYFPTYTLGAMTAAQLYAAAKRAIPSLGDNIRRGEFAVLVGWLRANIHSHGSFYSSDELLERATGSKLSAKPFIEHLKNRYAI